jgi:hypothetical protein
MLPAERRLHSRRVRFPSPNKHMRYSQPLAVAVVALTVAGPSAQAQEALGEEGFGFFYDSLAPYGAWINISGHGPCWRPEVEEGWSPYTDGYWAYTDVGWTWVSNEPFGSIVYHYGRWLLSSRGWCWVPGADWSPAWVSWRTGEEYIGWAPLPPEVPWHPQRGITGWVDVHTEIGPAYYRFCAVRDFSAPVLAEVLLRPSRNAVIMVRTENVTNITVRNNTVYCGGPRYGWVSENASGGVPLLRVAREENVRQYRSLQGSGGGVQNFVYNNILVLPAPRRVELGTAVRNFPAPPSTVSVSKGWYSDPSGNERLRTHITKEWEQRRVTQPLSGAAKDPGGPSVRLTAPTSAEKRAALNEIASTPAPAPWAGGGRSEKVLRTDDSFGVERPSSVPKALPVTPPRPVSQQKPPLGSPAPAPELGADRGAFGRPPQSGFPNGDMVPGGKFGGQQPVRPEPSPKTLPRSVASELPERTQGPGGQTVPPYIPNQAARGGQSRQDPEARPRTQSGEDFGKGLNGIGVVPGNVVPRNAVPGSAVSPARPPSELPSGFSQPQGSRNGSNFFQQGAGSAVGVPSRGGAQEVPFSGAGRSGGVSAPVQAAPLPRASQPPAVADQPARFQRTAPQQQQPSPGAPAGIGGAGIPGGGRPQSAPPVSSAAPPGAPAPAAPAGVGQKKKPGDPGYVPGNP